MKIEDLKGDIIYKGLCHDCGKHVEVRVTLTEENQIEISGGAVYKVNQGYKGEELFFKCDECFSLDHTLRNFKESEVFSRAVGYLRPVQQYNKGKKEEFKMRKKFTNMKGT